MSRFVSAGTIDAATGHAVSLGPDSSAPAQPGAGGGAKDRKKREEWEAVSRDLEEQRKRREEEARKNAEGGEKSLFDILQANKAAKQAAFEEANKIKNQFRPLDDDEIDFLDELQESKRQEEERTRREVEDGLGRFREAQNAAEDAALDGSGEAGKKEEGAAEEEWSFGGGGGRKRRRKDRDEGRGLLKGVVRRRTSAGGDVVGEQRKGGQEEEAKTGAEKKADGAGAGKGAIAAPKSDAAATTVAKPTAKTGAPAAKPSLGLVDYGSDDDSD